MFGSFYSISELCKIRPGLVMEGRKWNIKPGYVVGGAASVAGLLFLIFTIVKTNSNEKDKDGSIKNTLNGPLENGITGGRGGGTQKKSSEDDDSTSEQRKVGFENGVNDPSKEITVKKGNKKPKKKEVNGNANTESSVKSIDYSTLPAEQIKSARLKFFREITKAKKTRTVP